MKIPPPPLYSPLNNRRDIRLLRIQPRCRGGAIEIDCETYSLDSDLQFTALSYVWGSPMPQSWITCNGHNVSITSNLYQIFSQLRDRQYCSLLWADAICINQQNNKEKNIQVSMMRDIYKRAANVIFWLGQQECHDVARVRLMKVFVQHNGYHSDLALLRCKNLGELGLPSHDCGWIGWSSLLCRPWFGRVWIVQEFLNATRSVFMSGALEIPTNLLIRCSYATGVCASIGSAVIGSRGDLHNSRNLIQRPLSFSIDEETLRRAGIEDVRIVDLWTKSQLLEASNPRDRVFALLSMQTAVPMDIIDYNKEPEAVYEEIAKIALTMPVAQTDWHRTTPCNLMPNHWGNGPQRVSRFLACKTWARHSPSLPSWVPDWRPVGFGFVPLTRYFPGSTYFTHTYHHATIIDKVLFISGLIVDMPWIIVDSMPYMELSDHNSPWPRFGKRERADHWCRRMLNWQIMCYLAATTTSRPFRNRRLTEAFCRTMAFNALENKSETPSSEYISAFQGLHNTFRDHAGATIKYFLSFSTCQTLSNQSTIYQSVFEQLSAGRKFCVSTKGSLAWVPRDTKLGDRICFLAGCAVPFVVRPIGKSFELLGDCYLHNMMVDESITFDAMSELFIFR